MNKPYTEQKISESVAIRTFSIDTELSELQWHWDEEDRIVTPLNENDWYFQFDNELPERIYKEIHIPAGVMHRVIKGTTDLVVKIEKVNEQKCKNV
jgi:hypothetical protein